MLPSLLRTFNCLLVLFSVPACSPVDEEAFDFVDLEVALPLRIDEVDLMAEIAVLPNEQRLGLMHRQSLPADTGMLFPYKQPQRMSFWMANTPLPLNIAFFDSEGVLKEIHRMAPFDRNSTVSSAEDLRFALEMEAGWFAEKGLLPGAQLDLDLLRNALRRRGADPATYGL
jgi:uncharacterized membrane protein (UPF0127 family)